MAALDGRSMIAIANQNGRAGKTTGAIKLSAGPVQEGQRVLLVIRPVRNQSIGKGDENKGKNFGLCEEKADGYGRGDYRGIGYKL